MTMTKMTTIDILLLRYATGSLGTPKTVIVVVLLVFNADARRKVAEYETLGGQMLQEETPTPLSDCCLETVLKTIDAPPCFQSRCRQFLIRYFRF